MSRVAPAIFLLLASCATSSPDAAPDAAPDAGPDGAVLADAAVQDHTSERLPACGSIGSACCANYGCTAGAVCVSGTCLRDVECLSDLDCNGDGGGGLLQCTNGKCICATTCGDAGGCVDLTNDSANCGSCGKACPHNESCQSGTCVCTLTMCAPADAGGGAAGDGGTDAGSACVDLMTDNANCGTCGVGCDYTCGAGKCGPKVLATGKDGQMALDPSTRMLVMQAGVPSQGFYTCSAAGCSGSPTLIGPYGGVLGYIGASNGRFFFLDTQQSALFTCTESGCASPTSLGNSAYFGLSGSVAVTANSAFWADGQAIWTCPTNATCAPTKIAVGVQPTNVAVDGNDLYWAQGTGEIYVSDLGGNNAALVATDSYIQLVLAAGGQVFWVGRTGFMTAGRTTAAGLFGGCALPTCFGAASDGTNIYVLGAPQGGAATPWPELSKCPIGPSCTAPVTIVPWSGAFLGPNVVVDAKNVFWSENENLMVFHK
jgi:hypothetical protein